MIYLDNAATTIPCNDAILPFQNPNNYFNASSIYNPSIKLANDIDYVRNNIKSYLGMTEGTIYFTSGATESNNWLIQGLINYYKTNCAGNFDYSTGEFEAFKPHIITSCIEHDSILNVLNAYDECELEVTYLPVDECGKINIYDLTKSIKSNTVLVSIMYSNNEIGTVQPIEDVIDICHKKGILVHSDITQDFGKIELATIFGDKIDFLSASAHKFFGPKGVGFLYVKNPAKFSPLILGGGQEDGYRAGTLNAPAILGMNNALYYCQQTYLEDLNQSHNYIYDLNVYLRSLLDVYFNTNDVRINTVNYGHILSFSLKNIDAEPLVIQLSDKDIYVSTGSACNTGSLDPSHVMVAIGCPDNFINGTIRVSFTINNTKEELRIFIEELAKLYYCE